MNFRYLTMGLAALTLAACSQTDGAEDKAKDIAAAAAKETLKETIDETVAEVVVPPKLGVSLESVLADQSEAVKARYAARRPTKTLAYFGVEPGMTVAEVLPGSGWYSKILLPYLGDDGTLIGIDYSLPMWGKFGGFANEEFLEKRRKWAETWSQDAAEWRKGSQAEIDAFAFGQRPTALNGKVDVVLMVRAFHHLTRFERAHLQEALVDIRALLKKDGIVGIVQHRAPESASDEWASGDNGYLKQSEVIKIMEAAGFVLAGEPSEINANPKDTPSSADKVWRLPPTLGTSRDKPELKAKMEAIGESDRMTLKFRVKD